MSFIYRNPPKEGECVWTPHGIGIVTKIIGYEEAVQEMKSDNAAFEAIERFKARVLHFLGETNHYYECEIDTEDGSFRVDWSDWRPG